MDALRHSFPEEAPIGYATWLEKNISHYDPAFRGWRLRYSLPLTFRNQRSFKCWDEKCVHYIYGFPNQDDRDQHVEEHVHLLKRDSRLSVGGSPPLVIPDQPSSQQQPGSDYGKKSSSLYLPRPSAGLDLTGAGGPSQGRDHGDSLRTYSFVSEQPTHQHRNSVDSEVDPLLPPLKHTRVGQSRLKSIDELRLNRDIGPCLRCRVLQKGVSLLICSVSMARSTDTSSATQMTRVSSAPIKRALPMTTFGKC